MSIAKKMEKTFINLLQRSNLVTVDEQIAAIDAFALVMNPLDEIFGGLSPEKKAEVARVCKEAFNAAETTSVAIKNTAKQKLSSYVH